jgi:hypothetical protein
MNKLASHIAALWAGVILAGNFIAPTAKFRAPSLELATALEVGRITFRWMAVAEIALLALLIVIVSFGTVPRSKWLALPVTLLAAQWILIMPSLDARTRAIIAGETVPPSQWHLVYVAAEFLKFIAVLWLVWQWAREPSGTKIPTETRSPSPEMS